MASFIKAGMTALVMVAVLVATAGTSAAGFICFPCVIQIDDLTATPTVRIFEPTPGGEFDVTNGTVFNLQRNGELLTFNLGTFPNQTPGATYFDLFEDHIGGTLSDRLLLEVTAVPGNFFLGSVTFASDPASIAPGATLLGSLVEDGTFQRLTGFQFGPYDNWQVRSDAERSDVPFPATLLLLGAGIAGGAAMTWRRPRRA